MDNSCDGHILVKVCLVSVLGVNMRGSFTDLYGGAHAQGVIQVRKGTQPSIIYEIQGSLSFIDDQFRGPEIKRGFWRMCLHELISRELIRKPGMSLTWGYIVFGMYGAG